jgi:hypothetical protein
MCIKITNSDMSKGKRLMSFRQQMRMSLEEMASIVRRRQSPSANGTLVVHTVRKPRRKKSGADNSRT